MDEIAKLISLLGRAIDRAAVYGYPTDELRAAYEIAINLKSNFNK